MSSSVHCTASFLVLAVLLVVIVLSSNALCSCSLLSVRLLCPSVTHAFNRCYVYLCLPTNRVIVLSAVIFGVLQVHYCLFLYHNAVPKREWMKAPLLLQRSR